MSNTPSELLGKNLTMLRTRRRWSQRELVERLQALGGDATKWSPSKMTKTESGTRRATIDELFELAAALEVSPLYLITWEDDVQVTHRDRATAEQFRMWVRCYRPLTDPDSHNAYWYVRPPGELEAAQTMLNAGVQMQAQIVHDAQLREVAWQTVEDNKKAQEK